MFPSAQALTPLERKLAIIRNPLIVSPDMAVKDAIAKMNALYSCCSMAESTDDSLEEHRSARASCVLVVEDDQLVGILTERDVVRLVAQQPSLRGMKMQQVMSHPVATLCESTITKLSPAYHQFQHHHVRHLPVLDDQKRVVGVMTYESLQLAIAAQQAIANQQFQADLAERQQREAALRDSEAHLRALITALPDLITRINRAGIYLEFVATPTFQVVGNLPELVGTHVFESLPPDLAQKRLDFIDLALQTRSVQIYEQDLSTSNTMQIEEVRVVPYSEDEVLLLVRDISEQKKAEFALKQSEAKSKAILEAIPDLMFRVGADGVYRGFVTQNWDFGLLPQNCDPVGRPMADVLSADHAARQLHYLQKALETEELQVYEQQIQRGNRLQYEEIRVVKSGDDEVLFMIRDITDRKQAEIALKQSELTNRIIIETIPDLLIQMDREGRYSRMVGGSGVHVKQPSLTDGIPSIYTILSPEQAEQRLFYANQAIESGDLQIYEQVLEVAGSQRYEEVRIAPLNDQEVLIIIRDITEKTRIAAERKQAEAERIQAEKMRLELKLLEQILDVVLAGYWDWDMPNQREYLSPSFKRMLGYEDHELPNVPETWQKLIFQEDLPLIQECFDRHFQSLGKIPFYAEVRYRHQDGSTVWVICSGQVIEWDATGQPLRMIGCHIDITDRKRMEEKLEASQAKLQRLVDDMGDKFVFFSHSGATGIVNYVSDGAASVFGISKEEAIGNSWINMINWLPEDLEIGRWSLIQMIENKIGFHQLELRFIHKDGNERTINVSVHPVRDENSQLVAVEGILEDITDRKKAEQTIRQQANREAVLREITQKIRQSLDLQTIFDTACQEIHQVIHADRVSIFKFYPESKFKSGEFVAESAAKNYKSIISVQINDGCFGNDFASLYAKGRFHIIKDIYDCDLATCHIEMLSQIGVRAHVVMPLFCGDQLWGLLCVHQCATARQWQQAEIDLTQQLANQLAIAIQQASLYDQLQAELRVRLQAKARIALELRRQQTLGAIVQRIRESLDINEILATVTQQVKDILHGDRVIVFRLFPDGNSRIVEEAVSSDFPAVKERQWDNEVWSQEILDHYWQGKPRIVPDVMNDIWTDCLVEYSTQGQIQSKIVAPILQDAPINEDNRWVAPWETNKLWGILVVHACREKRIWQDTEAQLLQQIANQLAIAIQQANLFEQLQQELSERQQAEQQLTERNQQLAISNQELARATRLKDEFLANMSHELRTPLNAILGMTEGLQDQVYGTVNQRQLKALQTIERSGSHLLELINDILDVAKIESGQLKIDCTPTAVVPLCQASLAFIKQHALRKNIQLETKLPAHLPDLLVDERRIRQVLLNLLNNAVKFTPDGGHITLEVIFPLTKDAALAKRDYLRIAVTDTGIGIAPENLDRLFQPFIQIDSALNRQYTGTGLGLTLVKRLVELHGGQVSLTSQVGVGSCFMIDLPCAVSSPRSPQSASAGSPDTGAAQSTPTNSPLILLAEDNAANIDSISSYLRARGYRIVLAKNGKEAIVLADSESPDLILMDVQMPGMDGLEAIQKIRSNPHLDNVPIIALTALAMPSDRDRCLKAGATDYLSKPIRLKQLTSTIQQLLEARTK